MPLVKGRSKKVIAKNIQELMHSYHQSGLIGSARPPSNQAAQRQSVAIAMRKAGRSRKKK
jgi:hypothetical protein